MSKYEELLSRISEEIIQLNDDMSESDIAWLTLKIQEMATAIETQFRSGEMTEREHKVLDFLILSLEEEVRHIRRKQYLCKRFAYESYQNVIVSHCVGFTE